MAHISGLRQRIRGPTHTKGRMLDIIFTDNEEASAAVLSNAEVANHSPIVMTIPDDLMVMQDVDH